MPPEGVPEKATTPSSNEPSPKEKKRKSESKNCGLRKCFSALVDRKQVNLELEVLRLMLRKELGVALDALDPEIANILPYILVYHIKSWPGWQRSVEYYSGKIQFKTWYDKFQKYIVLKLSEAMGTHYKEALEDLNKEKTSETRTKYMLRIVSDKNTQTDNLAPKVEAPFTIEITAKPVLLNTIVFTDTPDGDIILKQHGVLEWDKMHTDNITLKQLITWPHVSVHMLCPIFSFSRSNLHEFHRTVSLVGTPLPPTSVEYIEEINIINPTHNRTAYTLDKLKEVSSEFMHALKNVYPAPAVLEAFQTVIDEFLTDVKEIDIQMSGKPTIASNTSVFFNIGRNTYFRNKKLSKGAPSRYDIGYTEVILPKMKTSLIEIADDVTMTGYLNSLRQFRPGNSNIASQLVLPQITFSCNYCHKNFDNGGEIATHLKEEHKMEQPMLCVQCKKSFPAFDLSATRWKHTCSVTPKVVTPKSK